MNIAENYPAALAAENISEGVDVDAACIQKDVFTGLLLDLRNGFVGCERCDCLSGSSGKAAAVFLKHFLEEGFVVGV